MYIQKANLAMLHNIIKIIICAPIGFVEKVAEIMIVLDLVLPLYYRYIQWSIMAVTRNVLTIPGFNINLITNTC